MAFDFVQPKVIPLDKSESGDTPPSDSLVNTEPPPNANIGASAAPRGESVPKSSEEKPSLFDMISKINEKFMNQTKATCSTASSTFSSQKAASTTTTSITAAASHPVENAKNFTYIENKHDNLNYTLWTLNLNKSVLRVLVRSCVDGYINTETSSFNSVVLHPKLEIRFLVSE